MRRCPIERLKVELLAKKNVKEAQLHLIDQKILEEIVIAFNAVKSSNFPQESALFDNIYSS